MRFANLLWNTKDGGDWYKKARENERLVEAA